MSDTACVQPPIPLDSVTPMPLANEPPKDEPTPIESGVEAMREVAKERVKSEPEAVRS